MNNEVEKNEILESISDKLIKYLDLQDRILENEYIQVIGEGSKVVSLLRNANGLVTQKRFEAFLKGFKSNGKSTEAQMAKLREYIENEDRAQFISDTLAKILLSKSTKACVILGTLMNNVIENSKNISHEYLICIDALSNLFDKDIENILFVFELIDETRLSKLLRNGRQFEMKCKKYGESTQSVNLTIEKAIYHNILRRSYEIDLNLDIDGETPELSDGEANNHEYLIRTEPGKILYDLIKRVG